MQGSDWSQPMDYAFLYHTVCSAKATREGYESCTKRESRLFRVTTFGSWRFVCLQATRTVERIGARIAEASGLEGCKWEFIVVKNDAMNAFALPGGKVRCINHRWFWPLVRLFIGCRQNAPFPYVQPLLLFVADVCVPSSIPTHPLQRCC